MEAMEHPSSSFVTLTYSDDNLPREFVHPKTGQVYADFSVNPEHHRLFLNKLRFHVDEKLGIKLRFYMIGEYGDKTQRPHYHYALFGYPRCTYGARWLGRRFIPCPCPSCTLLADTWGYGHIFAGELTLHSAQYIAGYVTKKLTSDRSEFQQQALAGRHPEFPRMSLKPGIAAWVSDRMAERLTFYNKVTHSDIPSFLIRDGKQFPLGRYILDRVYDKVGLAFSPNEKLKIYEDSLRSMLAGSSPVANVNKAYQQGSVAIALQLLNSQRVLDLEKKRQLFTKEKML